MPTKKRKQKDSKVTSYSTGGTAKIMAVQSGRVSPKYVTMELFNRLKAEIKALKKKR